MLVSEWDDRYAIRIRGIDEHHQELFRILNRLHNAVVNGHGRDVLQRTLEDLAAYTDYHFKAEEDMMAFYRYPQRSRHQQEHTQFKAVVRRYQNEYQSGKTALSLQLLEMLTDWLTNHILKSDRAYAAFLHRQGVNVWPPAEA